MKHSYFLNCHGNECLRSKDNIRIVFRQNGRNLFSQRYDYGNTVDYSIPKWIENKPYNLAITDFKAKFEVIYFTFV